MPVVFICWWRNEIAYSSSSIVHSLVAYPCSQLVEIFCTYSWCTCTLRIRLPRLFVLLIRKTSCSPKSVFRYSVQCRLFILLSVFTKMTCMCLSRGLRALLSEVAAIMSASRYPCAACTYAMITSRNECYSQRRH